MPGKISRRRARCWPALSRATSRIPPVRAIAVAVPVPGLGPLTYAVPEGLPLPGVGARVLVPLGNRTVTGIVCEAGGARREAREASSEAGGARREEREASSEAGGARREAREASNEARGARL